VDAFSPALLLKSFMKNVTFKTYNGLSHSSSDDEMDDVKVSGAHCAPFGIPMAIETLKNFITLTLLFSITGHNQ